MTRIIGIAGSLRKASFNAALLHAAAELAPTGTKVEIASIASSLATSTIDLDVD